MIKPQSVVIVKHSGGQVAHVRYADPRFDVDLSSNNPKQLDRLIAKKFKTPVGYEIYKNLVK